MWAQTFLEILAVVVICHAVSVPRVKRQTDNDFPVYDPDCENADIIFILDSSGSVGANNWQKVLDFTNSVVMAAAVSPDNIQV